MQITATYNTGSTRSFLSKAVEAIQSETDSDRKGILATALLYSITENSSWTSTSDTRQVLMPSAAEICTVMRRTFALKVLCDCDIFVSGLSAAEVILESEGIASPLFQKRVFTRDKYREIFRRKLTKLDNTGIFTYAEIFHYVAIRHTELYETDNDLGTIEFPEVLCPLLPPVLTLTVP